MTRVAAIDCGTNSIRLLVADADGGPMSADADGGPMSADADGGRLVDVVREMRVVRLGQDVDRTGRLAPEAIERTRVALVDYAATLRRLGASRVRMVATSATRDASNRDDFTRMVLDVLGVAPEVITGAEEAALSFAGAAAGLSGVQAPLLVADIGGGSTELVLGSTSGSAAALQAHSAAALQAHSAAALQAHSMDIGCVRLTERHLHDDPASSEQIAHALADIEAAIDQAALDVDLGGAATFVGVAGTVTTIAALVLGLSHYDPLAIHGSRISAADVHVMTGRLLGMTRAQRATLPVMHPGRVDVIGAGALILDTLLERTGATELIASEHDILDGIATSLLAG